MSIWTTEEREREKEREKKPWCMLGDWENLGGMQASHGGYMFNIDPGEDLHG